jgi:hypothetical protein
MTYLVEFAARAVRDLEILYMEEDAAESHAAARRYNGWERAVYAPASYPHRQSGQLPVSGPRDEALEGVWVALLNCDLLLTIGTEFSVPAVFSQGCYDFPIHVRGEQLGQRTKVRARFGETSWFKRQKVCS